MRPTTTSKARASIRMIRCGRAGNKLRRITARENSSARSRSSISTRSHRRRSSIRPAGPLWTRTSTAIQRAANELATCPAAIYGDGGCSLRARTTPMVGRRPACLQSRDGPLSARAGNTAESGWHMASAGSNRREHQRDECRPAKSRLAALDGLATSGRRSGNFISDEYYYLIDELTGKIDRYPPGRPLEDINRGGNPLRRREAERHASRDNVWRQRLNVWRGLSAGSARPLLNGEAVP